MGEGRMEGVAAEYSIANVYVFLIIKEYSYLV